MVDSSSTRKLGSLDPNHTAIMVCDLQEKFAPSILHFDTIVQNADRLVQAANILQMPVLATEQYPKVIHSEPENLKKSRPKNSSNEINQFHTEFFLDIFHFLRVKF